jgi:hypothetical protein
MPVIKILPLGGTAYMSYFTPTAPHPPRGTTKGWTRDVARRNTDFLLSVVPERLTGCGLALSLTVRDCPPTPTDWHRIRSSFVKRLRRLGMLRLHWLTEWQRRGVPHIHAAVWFPDLVYPDQVVTHWLQAAQDYQPGPFSQDVKFIRGAPGWFEYLAKHATRSVSNYQRSPESIPASWTSNTGRMWGHQGSWPIEEPQLVDLPPRPWFQYRRLMLRFAVGKARKQGDRARALYARKYRGQAPEETSHAQPLPRLWISKEHQWELTASALQTHPQSA